MSYYATKKLDIPNLIMITGSHNPKEYNGLKIIINNKPFLEKDKIFKRFRRCLFILNFGSIKI